MRERGREIERGGRYRVREMGREIGGEIQSERERGRGGCRVREMGREIERGGEIQSEREGERDRKRRRDTE